MTSDKPCMYDYQLILRDVQGRLRHFELRGTKYPVSIEDMLLCSEEIGTEFVHAILDVRTIYEDGMVLEYEGDAAYTIEHPAILQA